MIKILSSIYTLTQPNLPLCTFQVLQRLYIIKTILDNGIQIHVVYLLIQQKYVSAGNFNPLFQARGIFPPLKIFPHFSG